MGVFDRLFKRPRKVAVSDMVWMNCAAKWVGLVEQVRLLSTSQPVIVTAHFPATLVIVEAALRSAGLAVSKSDAPINPSRLILPPSGTVLLVSSSQLQPPRPLPVGEESSVTPAGNPVVLVAAERYPLPEKDQRLVDFTRALPAGSQLHFHVALDDVLMRQFAGDWTVRTLQFLGMDERTCIQDPRISRGIQRAQLKVAKTVSVDHPCDSPEQWLSRHFPSAT